MSKETYILLKQKKRKGLDLFYERYAKSLFQYAVNKWNCDEDVAWELIYQTMDAVIDSIDRYQFESESKFGSFVLTVFLNRIRNHWRNHKNQSQYIDIELMGDELNDESSDSEAISPLMYKLQTALQKLEEWERMLLLLRAQQLSYAEIANYIDKPENQLKVYYQRLKARIEKEINIKMEEHHEK